MQQNNFPNSCVVRISRALNYSGQPIHQSVRALTVSGADHKWYAFRVAEFETYMRHEYGPPRSRPTPPRTRARPRAPPSPAAAA